MGVLLHERNGLRRVIESEYEPAGLALLGRCRAVVEERDRAVGLSAAVVLPVELDAGSELVVARLPAKLPFNLAARAIDAVDRPGVARRDKQVVGAVEAYRVDVEVVEGSTLRGFRLALGERDV